MSLPPSPSPLSSRPELPAGIDRPEPATYGHAPRGTPTRDDLPRWPGWAPFAAMLLTLVVTLAGVLTIQVALQLGGRDINPDNPPAGLEIGGTVVQGLAMILAAVILARLTAGRVTPWQFGFRRVGIGRAIGWMVAVWIGFIVISGIYAALVHPPSVSQQAEDLNAGDSTVNLVVVTFVICVFAPFVEEVFFRGFLFTALSRWLGWVPGAVFAGAIFALIHAGSVDPVFLPPLAVLGVGLCVLYHQTGSLLPCFALHALNNSLAMGRSQDFGAIGTVALMFGATSLVLIVGLLAARSGRMNAAPATA
jgi:membrane protease YdiL (CAAX protease family)